jgi:hypothetical protein
MQDRTPAAASLASNDCWTDQKCRQREAGLPVVPPHFCGDWNLLKKHWRNRAKFNDALCARKGTS